MRCMEDFGLSKFIDRSKGSAAPAVHIYNIFQHPLCVHMYVGVGGRVGDALYGGFRSQQVHRP